MLFTHQSTKRFQVEQKVFVLSSSVSQQRQKIILPKTCQITVEMNVRDKNSIFSSVMTRTSAAAAAASVTRKNRQMSIKVVQK